MSWIQDRKIKAQKKLRRATEGNPIPRTDPLATGVHEAAHAVFSEGFGKNVLWATCYPLEHEGERMLGYVKSEQGALLNGPQMTMETLVGDIAEYPFTHGREYEFDGWMSGSDGEELVRVWRGCGMHFNDPDKAVEILREASNETAVLVRQSMRWITPVAVEMYANKIIQGDHIRSILKSSDFYTPQNPLFQYHLHMMLMRILAVGKMGGVEMPSTDGCGATSIAVIQEWFLRNAATLNALLMDKKASWNQWLRSDGQKLEMSDQQMEQLITCSDISRKFGARPMCSAFEAAVA